MFFILADVRSSKQARISIHGNKAVGSVEDCMSLKRNAENKFLAYFVGKMK